RARVVFRLFFFQAEDGIRAFHVTGVQTCALPIWLVWASPAHAAAGSLDVSGSMIYYIATPGTINHLVIQRSTTGPDDYTFIEVRSAERRVGKECRARGQPEEEKKSEWDGGWTGVE